MSTAIVLAGVGAAIVLEVLASPRASSRGAGDSGRALRGIGLLASLALLGSSVLAIMTTSSIVWALAGALLIAIGGGLRASAMRNLGPQFRTEAGAEALVTTGIHGVMRHPSELGLLAWVAGLLLAAPGVLAAALALAQLPLLAARLHIEESVLANRFGDAWLEYAARTSRFGC